MKKFAALGLAALFAAPAALAEPSGSWLPEVQQFNRQAVRSKDESARQADLFQGAAKVSETKNHQDQLTTGKYYTFFADCDRDCDNIDLTLKSADGSEIASDTEDDDAPMFSVRPARTGRYTLSVTIPGCKTESGCQYSSNVFVGNQQIFQD